MRIAFSEYLRKLLERTAQRPTPIELFGSLPFRDRAWELREYFTAADALFVALAERLGEPLATKDRGLASAARKHTRIETVELV